MLAPVLEQLVKDNPDVRVVYRHFPLPSHDKSLLASQATEAAGLQGKFWEMHDVIFQEQSKWVEKSQEEFKTWLVDQAGTLGLDKAKFTANMDSQEIVKKVQQAQADAQQANIGGTPYLLINGIEYPEGLQRDAETIMMVAKLVLLGERQYKSCPPVMTNPAKQYTATIKTDKGDIVIQLLPDKAPLAVNSFVFLAREGWFNGVTFHRVLPDFVAQTGDPTGTGYGGPGYAFASEISDLKFDKEGLVAMANSGPDTNGSQFFITMKDTPDLNGGYTIFGQVIQGMDVVKKLTERDPQTNPNLPPGDKINEVVITEK